MRSDTTDLSFFQHILTNPTVILFLLFFSFAVFSQDSANHGVRSAHLGDVVKVKDDGFMVEGIIVAMTDNNTNAIIDFGLDYITKETQEFESHEVAYKTKEIQDAKLAAVSPQSPREEAGGAQPSLKSFPVSVLTITMGSEEMEIGDQVEVRKDGEMIFFLGHIFNINRRLNNTTHGVEVTYDVEMSGNKGGEMLETPNTDNDREANIDMEIQNHHNQEEKHQQNQDDGYSPMDQPLEGTIAGSTSQSKFDIEYNVKPKNIRKLLSGRIKTMQLWKGAWRKISALLKFQKAGIIRRASDCASPKTSKKGAFGLNTAVSEEK